MVDKPRRRKKSTVNKTKIIAVITAALVVIGAGWYTYTTYIYKPGPIYAKILVGYANGTSMGTIEVELYPACAPRTVANFVKLAQAGFYDDLVWHRIVPKFVIQTGDPNSRGGVNSTRSSWGMGGSNTTVPLEICGWLHNRVGYLGMARNTGLNSGTSQFYINLANNTSGTSDLDTINGGYTVFGNITSGIDVAYRIARVHTYTSTYFSQPIVPVFVTNVTVTSAH